MIFLEAVLRILSGLGQMRFLFDVFANLVNPVGVFFREWSDPYQKIGFGEGRTPYNNKNIGRLMIIAHVPVDSYDFSESE